MFSLLLVLLMMITRASATVGTASTESASSTPSIPTPKSEPMDAANKRKRNDDEDEHDEEIPKLKTCADCRVALPTTSFYKGTNFPDGFRNVCKACFKARGPKCAMCPKRPLFGLVRGKATHCKQHKTPVMINVKSARCRDCNKQPKYGTQQGRPIYCITHKTMEMFNVVNPRCLENGCEISPSYGDDRKAQFCATHKKDGMVNVVSAICTQENCHRLATYNIFGQKPQWCSIHAVAGMINVVSKRCRVDGCDTRAHFGLPGQSKIVCYKHRSAGMINIKFTKCVMEGCSNASTHGIGVAMWCELHAMPTHVNMVERECGGCNLVSILNDNNLCEYCRTPMTEQQKITLKKQREVQTHLDADAELCEYEFTDRKIRVEQDILCTTNYRPDFLWDQVTHIVILEVDETQHKAGSYQCEEIRMRNIAESLMRPVIFIRFNPDAYKVEGLSQKCAPAARIKILKQWLMYSYDSNNVVGVVDTVHLFYDGFKAEDVKLVTLLEKFA